MLSSLLLAAGCNESGGYLSDERPQPRSRFAVIGVVRSESAVPGVPDEVQITGLFARERGFDRSVVLELASLPDVPDSALLALQPGHCLVVDREGSRAPEVEEFEAFVDFLDAGNLTVGVGERVVTRMRRRPFPELWASVNGVTYSTAIRSDFATGRIHIEGRGSPELGDFRVERVLPSVPMINSVGGEPVTSSFAAIDWNDDLEVRWSLPGPEDHLGVKLFVSLEALDYDHSVAVHCATPDTGGARLSASSIAAVGSRARSEPTVRLVVRRVAHVPFAAAGMHAADAFFVSRHAVLIK